MKETKVKKVNSHSCFFIFTIKKSDSQQAEKHVRDAFFNMVNSCPNDMGTFTNEKTGEHLLYNKKNILNVRVSEKRETIDLELLIKAVHSLQLDNKLKKKDFSYIFKGIKEKVFGIGLEDITPKTFCDYFHQKGIEVGQKSNIYKYIPQGNYPDWQMYRLSHLELLHARSIISSLLEHYNTLKRKEEEKVEEKVE